MFLRKKKAQATLEYIIVASAIIAAIIWASRTFMSPAVQTGLNNAATTIDNAATTFDTISNG